MGKQDRIRFIKHCWHIGDTLHLERWLGIEYVPPTPPEGMDLDDEWRFMVEHAREWIIGIYRRLYEPAPA